MLKQKDTAPESTSAPDGAPQTNLASTMPLLRNNYLLMAVAGVLIVVGFILIAGAPSGTQEYNPDIFSSRRIVVGPMLSFIGFVLMAVAIIVKPKK